MKSMSMSQIWLRIRCSAADMLGDRSGIAAIEFAVIVPVMLVMFFSTFEISSAVAVDRKLSLVVRTLSDLTSQSLPSPTPQSPSATVADIDLQSTFTASISILAPYSPTPTKATLSEIYIDSNQVAKIQWSKAATIASGATQATLVASSHNVGDIVVVPIALQVKKTYVILSEVSYLYTPAVGYVMGNAGVTLNDQAYTRPRQVVCVIYNNLPTADGSCPTL
jgi:Flp pilus assembly protein TadG